MAEEGLLEASRGGPCGGGLPRKRHTHTPCGGSTAGTVLGVHCGSFALGDSGDVILNSVTCWDAILNSYTGSAGARCNP